MACRKIKWSRDRRDDVTWPWTDGQVDRRTDRR